MIRRNWRWMQFQPRQKGAQMLGLNYSKNHVFLYTEDFKLTQHYFRRKSRSEKCPIATRRPDKVFGGLGAWREASTGAGALPGLEADWGPSGGSSGESIGSGVGNSTCCTCWTTTRGPSCGQRAEAVNELCWGRRPRLTLVASIRPDRRDMASRHVKTTPWSQQPPKATCRQLWTSS